MTEKRFTLAYEKDNWWAVKDYDITLWKEEVIGLLNEIHEENKQLKSENRLLKGRIQEYEEQIGDEECENLDTIDNQLFCDLYFNQVGDI